METAKEKKIREAWIEEIGEEKYNEVKHLIDKEGYLDNSDTIAYLKMGDFKRDKTVDYYDNEIFRPKSLNNISNNNGWQRIVEDGLPDDKNAEYIIGAFMEVTGEFRTLKCLITLDEIPEMLKELEFTHWRKKEVYPSPIY